MVTSSTPKPVTATADRVIAQIPEAVFHIQAISKVYTKGRSWGLRLAVDLDLYRGECVVLLGPSGSSKSTLLERFAPVIQAPADCGNRRAFICKISPRGGRKCAAVEASWLACYA